MNFIVRDESGHVLTEMFIPWDELWLTKRTLLVSVSYGEITWW